MFLAFDIMGEVGFSKDFDNLATGKEHPAIKGIHDHMLILGILSNVPWLLNIIGSIPGAAAGYTGFFNWCSSEINEKEKASLRYRSYLKHMLTDHLDLDSRSTPARYRVLAHEGLQRKRHLSSAFTRRFGRGCPCCYHCWQVGISGLPCNHVP